MVKLTLILFLMFALHIFADFNLQGIMATLKQRETWKKYPDKYKNDYKPALLAHSIEWSFIVMIPMWYQTYTGLFKNEVTEITKLVLYIILFIMNIRVHYIVDDEKANNKTINLAVDQIIHAIQIAITWAIGFLIV